VEVGCLASLDVRHMGFARSATLKGGLGHERYRL